MRRMLVRMGWTVLAVLVVIQVFRPDRANPPVDPSRTVAASHPMDPGVASVLRRSCMDCHSYETRWPWYSNIAPASWLLASHVSDGRRHVNFSDWAAYDPSDASHTLEEICEVVDEGEMPLWSYLLIHGEARLSGAEGRAVCEWARAARAQIGTDPAREEGDD